MHRITLTIDGVEYVAIPRADYLRFTGEDWEEGAVDAAEFTMRELGKNLKAAREHAGFTQAELAKKMKKSPATVSGSEAGTTRVSSRYVEKLLEACGLPEDWKRP